MRAGRLRHRVTIQQPSSSTNSRGGKIKSWSDLATVWASIEPLSGREIEQDFQLEPETTTRIVMRYKSGLTSNMRIKYGSRYYKILGITNTNERNYELIVNAVETKDYE